MEVTGVGWPAVDMVYAIPRPAVVHGISEGPKVLGLLLGRPGSLKGG